MFQKWRAFAVPAEDAAKSRYDSTMRATPATRATPFGALVRRKKNVVRRSRTQTDVRAASTTTDVEEDDDDAGERVSSTTRAMMFDDGKPLINVDAAARKKRESRTAVKPAPVVTPGVMPSRARMLRDVDEASRGGREDAWDEYGSSGMETLDVVERDTAVRNRSSKTGESIVEWMVKSTDEMLDDIEAREPPTALAAWELSKRAEKVTGNPAVKKTVDIVGKVSVAAVRAAAPVVADGAGKVVKEGGKFAFKAAVSAAKAQAGLDEASRRRREKKAREEEERKQSAAAKAAATTTTTTTTKVSKPMATTTTKAKPRPTPVKAPTPKKSNNESSSASVVGNVTERFLGALGAKKKAPEPEPKKPGFPGFPFGGDAKAKDKADDKRRGGGGFFGRGK